MTKKTLELILNYFFSITKNEKFMNKRPKSKENMDI